MQRNPIGYYTSNENSVELIENRFTDEEDFQNYSGTEPASYEFIYSMGEGTYGVAQQVKVKGSITLIRYDRIYGHEGTVDPDKSNQSFPFAPEGDDTDAPLPHCCQLVDRQSRQRPHRADAQGHQGRSRRP